MCAAEIRRLADDGAVGWQTTEKSINGEVEYCCGGVLPLLNFYATLLARGWPIGWLILLFQEDGRCFKWQSAAAKAKALAKVRVSNNLRVRKSIRTLFFTL